MTIDLRDDLSRALGNQYAIHREMGGSPRTRVFLARDLSLYRDVAVKLLSPELADGLSVERFTTEMRRTSAVKHALIVSPLLVGVTPAGLPYFTMPYPSGVTLRDRLREGRLPLADAVAILRDMATALAQAHRQQLPHGDLRPERVLLAARDALIAGFGMAHALEVARERPSQLAVSDGDPPQRYGPPEQGVDGPFTTRADVYAWGAIAYELLTGTHPSLATRDGTLPSPRALVPELSPAIASLVMACLATDPAQRPEQASALVDALRGTPASVQVVAPRKSRAPLIIASVVAIAAVGAALFFNRTPRSVGDGAAGLAGRHTLAVLPVSDALTDSSTRYFMEGVTDELTTALHLVTSLGVASRNAVHAMPPLDASDPLDLGRRLGVEMVLEGRLRRDSTRLELTVVVTHVADGSTQLRQTFQRPEAELHQLEQDVVRAVGASLSLAVDSTATSGRIATGATGRKTAHDLLLRARYAGARNDEASLREAVELYQRAANLEPDNVAAWRGVSEMWHRLADDFVPAREALAAAKTATARAWALDSTSSVALAERASDEFLYERNFSAADRDFARALRLDSASAHAPLYAHLLLLSGKRDSAIAVMERAARLDPLSPIVARLGPPLLTGAEQFDPLRAVCSNAVQIDSATYTFDCLRLQLRVSGRWRDYLSSCDSLEHACQGLSLHRLGRVEEAKRKSALLEAELRTRTGAYLDPGLVATWYAQTGDADRALPQLERALAVQSRYIAYLRDPYFFSELKGEPRFEAFVRRAGLQ